MYRTWVITRHTFIEAISQPIYSLLLSLGAAIIVVFMFLPFFTLGEDTVMFKVVGLDVINLLVLITTLFATSKCIHEEIEDRTMLTLMSKPVSRLEVLVGKYLGLIMSAGMAMLILGALLCLCTWYRVPGDYAISQRSIDEREIGRLTSLRNMHLNGLYPSLLLTWMQISVLAALSVAISTRFSLVVNLPTVIMLYLAGNLTRFIESAVSEGTWFTIALGNVLQTLLPFLGVFDIRKWAVYSQIGASGDMTEDRIVPLSFIWQNTAAAAGYGVCYIIFALAIGMLVFRNRELGGNEG